jgi:hypothetical protein
MELILLLLLIALLPVVGIGRMLFGRGANSWRRLVRPDIAALLVLTAGVAVAFALVRGLNPLEASCILVVALPAMIAFAWLGRYFLEDMVLGFRQKRDRHERSADLSFLDKPPAVTVDDEEVVQAEVVESATDQARPTPPS